MDEYLTNNNGFCYIRSHKDCKIENINKCKVGQTTTLCSRNSTYKTGEYELETFLLVILIEKNQKYNCQNVEKLIHNEFKKYHRYKNAGTEFYETDIINEIPDYLNKTTIKFKILTDDEINKLLHYYNVQHLIKVFRKNLNNKNAKLNDYRNTIQNNYVNSLDDELKLNKKVLLKAPTGFGKTIICYKLINKLQCKKILFITPRRNLNLQLIENKYLSFVNIKFDIIHFSHLNYIMKENIFKEPLQNVLITCCYHSSDLLVEKLQKYNFKFDLIIFDEAHFKEIQFNENLTDNINDNLITNCNFSTYKLFATATPTENMEFNNNIYGNIIEKVKIYDLIKHKILCDIETIVKQLDNKKHEYHNLKDLIIQSMLKFKKRKGIIYVNDCKNAENLYRLMKTQNNVNVYYYTTKKIEMDNINDSNITFFENDKKPAVIINVDLISYGYDNDNIDFICFADSRQSDISIRQILGRGFRWNKKTYFNKILHILIPLYKDQFNNYSKNEHLKKYLDYIIGECGKDIIIKNNGNGSISNGKNDNLGNNYDGENIPIEILNEYCTTGYNKYTNFLKFLKTNNITNEHNYNKLKETQLWMPDLSDIQTKYPKFGFKLLCKDYYKYYLTKNEAVNAYNKCCDELMCDKTFKKMLKHDRLIKCNEINNKIPIIEIKLYYPN
jgi:superfamily II DNA or RNA helicase